MRSSRFLLPALAAALLCAAAGRADLADSLHKGTPDLKSAGPLAFGPEGILFVGDPQGAAVFAFDTGDRTPAKSTDRPKVEGIDDKIASMVGIDAKQLLLNDVAVNPISGNVYVSASRGKGPDAAPLLFRVDRSGKIDPFDLKDVKFSQATLPNPVAQGKSRQEAITHLAFVKNRLYVAGMSNEDFSSQPASPSRSRSSGPTKAPASRSSTARTAGSKPSRRCAPSWSTTSRSSRTCWRPTPARRW